MTKTLLITGANRGLGLEFVRQYATEDCFIFACCRHPEEADALQTLQKNHPNKIQIQQLDVTSMTDIEKLQQLITQPIDILLNVAGTLIMDPPLGKLEIENFTKTFLVNTVSPIKMTEAFTKQVAKSHLKLIVALSSSMGSIAENTSGGYYSYRSSKSALNMVMKSAAYDLMSHGIKVLLLHPGWVKTRMGGTEAALEPEISIAGMRKVIESYNPPAGEVTFYRYNGEIVPW
jgi:NAD(P)-dependent dehydrogenase (short-subunit alcohol dehydrogenase family)